jgi:hypothetical protein
VDTQFIPSTPVSDPVLALPDGIDRASLWPRVQAIAESVFKSPVKIFSELDVETDEPYDVVQVPVQGTPPEIVALFNAWHERLGAELGKNAGQFRLSLDIQ